PRIWDPTYGTIEEQFVFRTEDGGTSLPVFLPPGGSVFIVFDMDVGSGSFASLIKKDEERYPGLPIENVVAVTDNSASIQCWQNGTYLLTGRKGLEELIASIQVMSNAGIQGGEAGTALRRIILNLSGTNKEALKVFQQFGIEISDAAGKMRSMADIIDELQVATEGMGETQRTMTFGLIAGARGVAGFSALVEGGGAQLRFFEKQLENAGGTAQKVATTQIQTLSGRFTILKSEINATAIAFGEKLQPAADALIDTVSRVNAAFNTIGPAVSDVLDDIANLFGNFGMAWNNFWDDLIAKTAEAMASITEAVRTGANDTVSILRILTAATAIVAGQIGGEPGSPAAVAGGLVAGGVLAGTGPSAATRSLR
ncbi:hypothetical protein LCGC14_2982190, partial [marine sediment metagenome]